MLGWSGTCDAQLHRGRGKGGVARGHSGALPHLKKSGNLGLRRLPWDAGSCAGP